MTWSSTLRTSTYKSNIIMVTSYINITYDLQMYQLVGWVVHLKKDRGFQYVFKNTFNYYDRNLNATSAFNSVKGQIRQDLTLIVTRSFRGLHYNYPWYEQKSTKIVCSKIDTLVIIWMFKRDRCVWNIVYFIWRNHLQKRIIKIFILRLIWNNKMNEIGAFSCPTDNHMLNTGFWLTRLIVFVIFNWETIIILYALFVICSRFLPGMVFVSEIDISTYLIMISCNLFHV